MKKRNKKAQTTVFIIIAVVVLAIIAGILYFKNIPGQTNLDEEFFSSNELKPQVDRLQTAILDCTEQTSEEALTNIGLQGGYFNPPSESLKIGEIKIPYYYNQGSINRPSKSEIETELNNYIESNLESCFENINKNDLEIEYKNLAIESEINNDNIIFNYNTQIKITKDNKHIVFELEDHPKNIPSALSDILDIAYFITDTHEVDPEMYCISCVGDMAEEKDVYVSIVELAQDQMLVVISENRTSTQPYSFEFLNKYTGEEASPETPQNQAPQAPGSPQ